MATAKVCDVFGTAKGVKVYRVTIHVTDCDVDDSPEELVDEWCKELCPRGYERLLAKIGSGLIPPTKRTKKNATNSGTAGNGKS